MKKFTTTFFLLMAMVLLLPTEVKAYNVKLHCSSPSSLNGRAFEDKGSNVYSLTIDNPNEDIKFRINVEGWDKEMGAFQESYNLNVGNGETYSISNECHFYASEGNHYFKIANSAAYKSYTITVNITDNAKTVKVEGEASGGGSDTGSNYYLYYSTGDNWSSASSYCVNSDNKLKLVDGKYNVTFTIPSANTGSFYFCVFKKENKVDWDNAIRPVSGNGTGDNNTATSGTINNSSGKVWLYETSSSSDVTLTLSLSSDVTSWTLTKGEITPTVTYTLKYGEKEIKGSQTDNVITFPIPASAYSNGLSFTITDSEGKTYNPSSDTSLSNGVASGYAENGSGAWTCSEKANAKGYTVTLDKDNRTVKMDWSTNVIIPVLTKNLYLVGDFLSRDNDKINYDCRYFKLTDNGDGTYSIDIPASIRANFQLLYSDGTATTLYGPQGSGYGVNSNNPKKGGTISGGLSTATNTPSNYWAQTNRFTNSKEEAGMYHITVTLGEDGNPSTWELTHDQLTRVAYYLPDMEGAALHPSYGKRDDVNSTFNNVYFGYVYLPANTGCYVVSNLCGQGSEYEIDGLLGAKDKLYLQGNTTGGNPGTDVTGKEKDKYTKVFPIISDKSYSFIFDNDKAMSMLLEYAPARGSREYMYNDIFGEVLKSSQTPETVHGGTLPDEFKSMKIIGPAIGDDTWNTDNGLVMEYNPSDNCWEASFDTDFLATEEKKFRFIANDEWKYSWEENGTEKEETAKIPYDDETITGQPATVAKPNKVVLVDSSTTSAETRTENLDIVFNRDPGHWTVKFYIEVTKINDDLNSKYKYNFKYTINGTPRVDVPVNLTYRVDRFIRSFSYGDNLDLPADESVKAYEAYRFEKGDQATKKHGTVYLRRITYIPANMGVILVGEKPEGASFNDGDIKAYNLTKRTEDLVEKNEDLWWKAKTYENDEKWSEWNNYLVGTVTAVYNLGNAKKDENGNVIERYFGLGHYWATNEYKKTHEGDDYIGFFRYTADAFSGANKAYLSIPTAADSKFGYIDFNGQWLDDGVDSPEDVTTLSRAAVIFDDEFVPTGIDNIVINGNNADNDVYYNLQGMRVVNPVKGIYIHNGKKVIIK